MPDDVAHIIALEKDLLQAWTDPEVRGWTIGGHAIWPLICHSINTVAVEAAFSQKRTLPGSFKGHLFLFAHSLFGEPTPQRLKPRSPIGPWWRAGDTVCVASRSARDPKTGVCRTTDVFRSLVDEGRAPILYVDSIAPPSSASGEAGPHLMSHTSHHLGSDLSAIRAHAPRLRGAIEALPGFKKVAQSISSHTQMPVPAIVRWLERLMGHFLAYVECLDEMVTAAPPSAFILTDHGDALNSAICSVAYRHDVPVACVQHGVLRRTDVEHPGHPMRGTSLPTQPPQHWVWRSHDLGDSDVCVGPTALHPPVMMETGPVAEEPSDAADQDSTITVLAAAQPASQVPTMADAIAALFEATGLGGKVVWRAHPRSSVKEVPLELSSRLQHLENVTVSSEDIPLVQALLVADLVVTGYSAVALEAEALGVPVHCITDYAAWLLVAQCTPELVSFGTDVPTRRFLDFSSHASPKNGRSPQLKSAQRMVRFRSNFGELPKRALDEVYRPCR